MEFLSVLPNLSIGVIAVLALAWISRENSKQQRDTQETYLDNLREMRQQHEDSMQERENALRQVEKDIRERLAATLSENVKVMERVVNHLDSHV